MPRSRRNPCGRYVLGACCIGAMLFLAPDAQAYYDDVHYALTYLIARQSGFTPQQAYRIASADVRVDWSPLTEPVQPTGQKLQMVGVKQFAQTPRWKFHAFRNELKFPGTAGSGTNPAAAAQIALADLAIRSQQEELWNLALTFEHRHLLDSPSYGGNPGVFLHSFQDKVPHAHYGSAWGHWQLDPEFFPAAQRDHLPVGGSTDWISFRPQDVITLTEETADWLRQFMERVSPLQTFQPYRQADYTQIVRQLAAANPAPNPIATELEREQYQHFFVFGESEAATIANLAAQLRGKGAVDFEKQKAGPRFEAAEQIINRALEAAGMPDKLPSRPYPYTLTGDGDLWPWEDSQAATAMIDNWVLTGTLKIWVTEQRTSGPAPLPRGTVAVRLAKYRRDGQDQLLGRPKPITAGSVVVFDKMPVGDLIIDVTGDGGSILGRVSDLKLDKRELEVEVLVPSQQTTNDQTTSGAANGLEGTEWKLGSATVAIRGTAVIWTDRGPKTDPGLQPVTWTCSDGHTFEGTGEPARFTGSLQGNTLHVEFVFPPQKFAPCTLGAKEGKYASTGSSTSCTYQYDAAATVFKGSCTSQGSHYGQDARGFDDTTKIVVLTPETHSATANCVKCPQPAAPRVSSARPTPSSATPPKATMVSKPSPAPATPPAANFNTPAPSDVVPDVLGNGRPN